MKIHDFLKRSLIPFLLIFAVFTASAQPKKPAAGKGSVKAKLAADMDCLVKVNNIAKPVSVKAYNPVDVTVNVGENTFEATSADKKSTFRKTLTAKAGEELLVEISFFNDGQFLDYVKQGNTQMVETALKKDPNLLNNLDGTLTTPPLLMAIENSQADMVKYLVDKGASFTKPEMIYPLHKALLRASAVKPGKDKPAPDKVMVELFLAKGCKITDKDDGGNTPLHCAVRAGKLDMVTYLVEKGADVNAKNDFDDTPLKIAQDKGLITIITYLKNKGALEK